MGPPMVVRFSYIIFWVSSR